MYNAELGSHMFLLEIYDNNDPRARDVGNTNHNDWQDPMLYAPLPLK